MSRSAATAHEWRVWGFLTGAPGRGGSAEGPPFVPPLVGDHPARGMPLTPSTEIREDAPCTYCTSVHVTPIFMKRSAESARCNRPSVPDARI